MGAAGLPERRLDFQGFGWVRRLVRSALAALPLDAPVLVAFSGGLDSTVLLDALSESPGLPRPFPAIDVRRQFSVLPKLEALAVVHGDQVCSNDDLIRNTPADGLVGA